MWLLTILLATSCATEDKTSDTGTEDNGPDPRAIDDDGDGLSELDGDCDDEDPLTYPGSAENEAVFGCMTDADGDGWGNSVPLPGVAAGTDCDDTDPTLNRDDEDGDGSTSCNGDCDDLDGLKNLLDQDEDGQNSCDGDCDDFDPFTFTGAAELEDITTCKTDADDDGWGSPTPTAENATPGSDCNDADSRENHTDVDGDGVSSCNGDCDDNSSAIHPNDNDGDGESPCDGDCNDNDPELNRLDADGDGYTSCYHDCDDYDENTYPEAIELCDGKYNNCSTFGYSAFLAPFDERDDDGDGSVECQDDGSVWMGTEAILGYGDCDDASPVYNQNDIDGDGFTTCNNDCDDANQYTFPGAAFNESTTDCMTDADGDGYGDILNCCYTLYMLDNWGDGWNGGYITAYENGISIGTYSVSESSGSSETDYVCVGDNSSMMLMYTGGNLEFDNSYVVYDPDGNMIFNDGPPPQQGAVLAQTTFWSDYVSCTYNVGIVSGTDCNDTDDNINIVSTEVYGDNMDNNCNGITDGQSSVSFAETEYVGENGGDKLGKWIKPAGDVDGDGTSDILLSSPVNDDVYNDGGKIYIVFGSSVTSGVLSVADADIQLTGEAENDQAGISIASAGDVDGDEQYDILVGAQYNDENGNAAGKAYLILGSTMGLGTSTLGIADYQFLGENPVDLAGHSVDSAGDVNDDGYDDILIGAKYNDDGGNRAGKAYLILGGSLSLGTNILSTADSTFTGEEPEDHAAHVHGAGDIDGDGFDDILISAQNNDDGGNNAGKTYLMFGSSITPGNISLTVADLAFVGEEAEDYSGFAIKGVGDINGDGLEDVAIGAYGNDGNGTDAGKAYIITNAAMLSSSIDLSNASIQIYGENPEDWAGYSITEIADLEGDNKNEVLIGAPQNDEAHSNAGKVYMLYSSNLVVGTHFLADADLSYTGADTNNYAGTGLISTGDVNNDGNKDLLIGAYGNNLNGPNTGKAYLFLNPLD